MFRKHFKGLVNRQYEKGWTKRLCLYFSVDYDTIAVSDILDIHKYLMKKNGKA